MYEVVSGEHSMEDVTVDVAENIDLVSASMNMTFLDWYIQIKQENLKNVIHKHSSKIQNNYDLILIDLPPSLNTILSASILTRNLIIIPTTAGRYALKGVNVAISEIEQLTDKFKVK